MRKSQNIFAILVLILFQMFSSGMAANGCGSKINKDCILKLKGLQDLIPCCNNHDDCYG